MKIRVIRDDKECARQLKKYFLLLLKADHIQSSLEKIMRKQSANVSVLQKVLLKKYYKLGIIGRQLYLIKNNINYYIICVNTMNFDSKLTRFNLQPLEELCAG